MLANNLTLWDRSGRSTVSILTDSPIKWRSAIDHFAGTGHHLRVHSSLLSVVLNDEGGPAAPGAAKLTANGKKALEPPAEPGEQPEKERARRPPLSKPSRAMELNAPK